VTGIRVKDNDRVADAIDALASAVRRAGVPVIWLKSFYDYKYLAPAHIAKRNREGLCMEGSWGADYFRIRPQDGDHVVVKHTFDGFHETELHQRLRALGVKTLLMTDVATNVCVDTTLRSGFVHGYHIVVVEDCVGSGNHQAHLATLSTVRVNIGQVIDSQRVMRLISSAAPVTG